MATSKKPTGLQIDRKGNKYIFSWQKPQTYEDGQRLVWIYKATKTHKSDVIKLGKSAKNYTVTSPSKLKEISFKVKGNHDQDSKDPGWSDWASKSFAVHPPKKPTVSAAWSAGTPNKTTFTYTATDEEHHPFDHVEYRTKWIKNFNGKPKSYSWTGATSTSSSKTGTIFNSTETVPAGQSYTRVVQCRSVGPGGVAKDPWVFKWHTYAKPNVPVITKADGKQIPSRSVTTLNLEWKISVSSAHPIDKTTVQYKMTVPGAGMTFPVGESPEDADTPAGKTTWSEEIPTLLNTDQCLFARIHVQHDTRDEYSAYKIALTGKLAVPTNVSTTPTQGTHTITVNATNASSVPDSYLACVYKNGDTEAILGIIPNGSSSVNMVVPPWTTSSGSVGVYAVVGAYTAQPADADGVVVYTIASPQMTSGTVWKGVMTAPTINVVQAEVEETATVTWDWVDDTATGAEVSWSDHEDAWESTDEPETHIVDRSKASRLNVSGLEPGIMWYFRVRLITEGDTTGYGLYSNTFSLNLSSAPAIPVLEMSTPVIDPDGKSIASWVYVSGDNTPQLHATIATYAEGVYTEILQAEAEQTIVIRPSDLEWTVGDYQLAVKVESESGRWSEYSDPIPVTVAEPLTCSISDTSLVYDSIPVNPEEYTGNPVIFDTGEQEKEVLSLNVELLPVQEGSGTPSPTNIRPITGRTQTDVVVTDGDAQSTTKTVTLPHTVYGGTVDVIGGQDGQSTMAMVDLGTLTWAYATANGYFYAAVANKAVGYNNIICSIYKTSAQPGVANLEDKSIVGENSGRAVLVKDSAYTDAATFKAAMNGVQLCYELATPTPITTTPTPLTLYKGDNVISSDGEMTMEIADAVLDGYFLKEMPMTVTVTGAGVAGQTVLTLKRKADYVIMKPDETELVGHADEVICQHVYTGEAQQTISIDEVQGKLNDGATYYIEATVTDDLGRQASDRYPNGDPDDYFKVIWDEQAIMPEATAEIINNDYAKLTITKPQDWADGDVVDIYRMTSDKPQKIAEDVEMDDDPVEYVDPYPTLGENGGYRFVYKTINGDDTLDADDNFAWLDVKAVCHSAEAIIDFNGERIPLPYNLKVSNSWGKDFQETRYLGGHIAGDWTAGVSRSGSIDSVTVPVNDPAVFRSIRRLAEYTELCHVRTLDGSVMTCNVDVDDDFGYDTAGKIQSVKLDFTRVDPVDLDAVPLADWLVTP